MSVEFIASDHKRCVSWPADLDLPALPIALLQLDEKLYFDATARLWQEQGFELLPVRHFDKYSPEFTAALFQIFRQQSGLHQSNFGLFCYTVYRWLQAELPVALEDDDMTRQTLLQVFEKPVNARSLDDQLRYQNLDELSAGLLKAAALPSSALVQFGRFSPAEKELFLTLTETPVKRNYIIEFIDHLYTVDQREAFLEELIDFDQRLTEKQKQHRNEWIREKIHDRRFPRLSQKKAALTKALSGLKKDSRISLLSNENLEDNSVRLEIRLKKKDDAAAAAAWLNGPDNKQAINSALDVISEGS